MTDVQLFDSVKRMVDACFASGLVKTAEDAKQMLALLDALTTRLRQQQQP